MIVNGYYASFSDLVRTALRTVISDNQYDLWAKEAKEEYRKGKATVLNSPEDITAYVKNIATIARRK